MAWSAFFTSSIKLVGKHIPIETSENSSSNHAQLYVICDRVAEFLLMPMRSRDYFKDKNTRDTLFFFSLFVYKNIEDIL